ncbi:CBS domain-containing protein [Candidatus Woesearchaeota archaeon]|nr:CBS domain-containing protein [Candidatus Woesearchaeota archaeon]
MAKKISFFLVLFILILTSAHAEEPTKIYGQVLLRDTPFEKLEVTAHWMDNTSVYHATTTETLTKSEARSLGDSSLRGYYFFNDDKLRAKKGSTIIITFKGTSHKLITTSNPGGATVRVTTISLSYGGFATEAINMSKIYEELENPEDMSEEDLEEFLINTQNISVKEIVQEEDSANAPEIIPHETLSGIPNEEISIEPSSQIKADNSKISKFFRDLIVIIVVVIIGLAVVLMSYYFIKYGTTYIVETVSEITLDPIEAQTKRFLNKKIKALVKESISISFEKTLRDAIELIVRDRTDTIIVLKDDSYLGFITEKNILKAGLKIDTKIKDCPDGVMSKNNLLIESGKNIGEAYETMSSVGERKLGVIENNKLIGEISLFDIQSQMSGFSRFFGEKTKSGLTTVRDMMSKNVVLLDKNENIEKAESLLRQDNVNMIVVTEDYKPLGVFTVGDYIVGMSKYGEHLQKHNVGVLMSSPFVTVNPDLNIFEANEFMLKKEFKRYPVSYDGPILGILDQKKLCAEMFSYFENKG